VGCGSQIVCFIIDKKRRSSSPLASFMWWECSARTCKLLLGLQQTIKCTPPPPPPRLLPLHLPPFLILYSRTRQSAPRTTVATSVLHECHMSGTSGPNFLVQVFLTMNKTWPESFYFLHILLFIPSSYYTFPSPTTIYSLSSLHYLFHLLLVFLNLLFLILLFLYHILFLRTLLHLLFLSFLSSITSLVSSFLHHFFCYFM